jgi:3-hydroxyisobutyrate dehydrogenase-like beta-hydroxyacid dehydrogenase
MSLTPISPMDSGSHIGLIGIGLMGTALAQRLLDAGASVFGWDLSEERCRVLTEMGGICSRDANDVLSKCNRVLLSLPSHETVEAVISSAGSLWRAGQIVIDTSTGDPDAAVVQAARLSERGVEYLDATISGSSQQVRDGSAVFLVGGSDFAYISCLDLFDCLTTKSFHTGAAGSGARMKLVTNLVLGLNRAALAEGLFLAKSLGLDMQQTLFLLKESMSYSRIMDTKGDKMLSGDFAPQARLSQHLKDVHLMLHAAGHVKTHLPLTETHRQLLELAMSMGLGELDNSAVFQVFTAFRDSEETVG